MMMLEPDETHLRRERASTAVITNAATLHELGDLGLQVHSL